MKRRSILKLGAAALAAPAILPGRAFANDPIVIGAVAPKTGPLAGGAAVSHWPNITLWASQVNARGGLNVGGTMRPVEIIEYDDQTNPGETIRAVQRLATQDNVDFMLAPYGTGLNIAAAPLMDRFGYPQITSTCITDQVVDLSGQFSNMFFLLGGATGLAEGIVGVLAGMRDAGQIGSNVAMVNVADAFGIELAAAGRPALEAAGFNLVYDSSYPLGTQDVSPVMRGAKDANPDAFIGFSYPPDTFGLTEQAQIEGLEVGAFYTAVGSSFPGYGGRFGAAANGILGAGGVNATSEAFQAYATAHTEDRRSGPRLLGLGDDVRLSANPGGGHRDRRRRPGGRVGPPEGNHLRHRERARHIRRAQQQPRILDRRPVAGRRVPGCRLHQPRGAVEPFVKDGWG
jgi:branched-chain amino acid transport system substrate-binding protein